MKCTIRVFNGQGTTLQISLEREKRQWDMGIRTNVEWKE